jgi:hypothetical protein
MTRKKRKPAPEAGDGLPVSLRLAGAQSHNSQPSSPSQQSDRRAYEQESLRIARAALEQRGCMALALAGLATHYARLAAGGAR